MTFPVPPRWVYRFDNYARALALLRESMAALNRRDMAALEKLAAIQAYEITYELGWKLLKDYVMEIGIKLEAIGPKLAIRAAYNAEIIADPDIWLDALEARNLTVHTYNPEIADKIIAEIHKNYLSMFENLYATMHRHAEAMHGGF